MPLRHIALPSAHARFLWHPIEHNSSISARLTTVPLTRSYVAGVVCESTKHVALCTVDAAFKEGLLDQCIDPCFLDGDLSSTNTSVYYVNKTRHIF